MPLIARHKDLTASLQALFGGRQSLTVRMFLDISNNLDQNYAAEFYQSQTKEEAHWRQARWISGLRISRLTFAKFHKYLRIKPRLKF